MKNLLLTLFCLSSLCAAAQDGEFKLDQVYPINKTGTIDLSSSDAKVFITGSLRPDVHVTINRKVITKGFYNSREEFRVDVEPLNGNLRIREFQNSHQSGFITYQEEDYKIVIEAPEGVTLSIRGDDGDYFVKNIHGAISMSIDDADAQLTNCRGDNFSFRIDDGDIRMDTGRGVLDLDADDADIDISNANFSSINARIDDGDFIVQTGLKNDGQYTITCQDGLVALDITNGGGDIRIRHDDGHITTNGKFNTTFESDDEMRLTLGTGSARVSVRADDARVKLTAN